MVLKSKQYLSLLMAKKTKETERAVIDMERRKIVAYNFKRIMNLRGYNARQLADIARCDESQISQILTMKVGFGVRSERKWGAILGIETPEFYKPVDPLMQRAMEILENASHEEKAKYVQLMEDQELLKKIKTGV